MVRSTEYATVCTVEGIEPSSGCIAYCRYVLHGNKDYSEAMRMIIEMSKQCDFIPKRIYSRLVCETVKYLSDCLYNPVIDYIIKRDDIPYEQAEDIVDQVQYAITNALVGKKESQIDETVNSVLHDYMIPITFKKCFVYHIVNIIGV